MSETHLNFITRALSGDAQHPFGGLETGPSKRRGYGIPPDGIEEMAEKMGIEELHFVRGEAMFTACLPTSWFCDLGQAHL